MRFLERIGKLVAYGLIIAGILFLWIYWSAKDRKEQQQKEIKTEQPTQQIYKSAQLTKNLNIKRLNPHRRLNASDRFSQQGIHVWSYRPHERLVIERSIYFS